MISAWPRPAMSHPRQTRRAETPGAGLAYDIVYNPLETRFLREARQAGRRCVTGLEMFFGQGDAQFRLWTGRPLPAASRQDLEAALYGAH